MDDLTQTAALQIWLDRHRSGDPEALSHLANLIAQRLEVMIHRRLRASAGVRRWESTGDVLQGVQLRLMKALEQATFDGPRQFLGYASAAIQSELIDLARRHRSRNEHHESVGRQRGTHSEAGVEGVAQPVVEGDPEVWQELLELVERLPPLEREVMTLRFVQCLDVNAIADLLGISRRTVSRHLTSAQVRLGEWARHRELGP